MPGPPEPEMVLHGGEINDVVRVGDTVRRAWRASTPTIHALLEHVRGAGFPEAPEPLGRDEQGREVLRYIEGTVPMGSPVPAFLWSDARSSRSRTCFAGSTRRAQRSRRPGTRSGGGQ